MMKVVKERNLYYWKFFCEINESKDITGYFYGRMHKGFLVTSLVYFLETWK